jgi:catechol 2,3-dioxygenase-like lactoylglutathione lyase family enzyme
MLFHHGVIAVRDLRRAIDVFRDVIGLDTRPGGRHGGRGTENAVIRFRDSYIELLSIFDTQKEIAVSGLRGQVLADYLAGREGGLVGYCLATDEIFRRAEALRSTTMVEVPEPLLVTRKTPSGQELKWHVLLPGGVNWRRPWPFLIQADPGNPDENAGAPKAGHSLGATGVAGLGVVVRDLARSEALYRHFGLVPSGRDGVPELGAERLRFVREGFSIDLLAPAGPGAVRMELDDAGEGLFQLSLCVEDMGRARAWLARSNIALLPAPGCPGGQLIPPGRAAGARLVLVNAS